MAVRCALLFLTAAAVDAWPALLSPGAPPTRHILGGIHAPHAAADERPHFRGHNVAAAPPKKIAVPIGPKDTEGKILKILTGASPITTAMHYESEVLGLPRIANGDASLSKLLELLETKPPPAAFNVKNLVGKWNLQYSHQLPTAVREEILQQVDNVADMSVEMSISDSGAARIDAFVSILGGGSKVVTLHGMITQKGSSSTCLAIDENGRRVSAQVTYFSKTFLLLRKDVEGCPDQASISNGIPHLLPSQPDVWTKAEDNSRETRFIGGRESLQRFGLAYATRQHGKAPVPLDIANAIRKRVPSYFTLALAMLVAAIARECWQRASIEKNSKAARLQGLDELHFITSELPEVRQAHSNSDSHIFDGHKLAIAGFASKFHKEADPTSIPRLGARLFEGESSVTICGSTNKASADPKYKCTPLRARKRGKGGKGGKGKGKGKGKEEEKEEEPEEDMLLITSDSMTITELAKALKQNPAQLISYFFLQGKPFKISDVLNRELCEEASAHFGVELLFDDDEKESEAANRGILSEEYDDAEPRPAVVTVMGHVDHGKTTLLDTIRNRSVAATEAGGITQRIGAYTVQVGNERATFIDTPGHEAFTAMRARGAQVTDIAVLVVAADDGVMPQTKEAIAHARAADVPIIVAINKIDKPKADPENAKKLLSEENVIPEEWGGDTPMLPISAKKNIGVDELLEIITLTAQVGELKARCTGPAAGIVLESCFDEKQGSLATLLVQRGELHIGDFVVAGTKICRTRKMMDDAGKDREKCTPSVAVQVLGFSGPPESGESWEVYTSMKEAQKVVKEREMEEQKQARDTLGFAAGGDADEMKLSIILRADSQGSIAAVKYMFDSLEEKYINLRWLLASPGVITESDVSLATATPKDQRCVIVGFSTKATDGAEKLAAERGIKIMTFDIIYELFETVVEVLQDEVGEEEIASEKGIATVLAVFKGKFGKIAGCRVEQGVLTVGHTVHILREGEKVGEGPIRSLRVGKSETDEVDEGNECGFGVEGFDDWMEGDEVQIYQIKSEAKKLVKAK